LVLYKNCELLNKSNRTYTYLLTYLLTPWLQGPQTALASLITDIHSSLPVAFYLLTFDSHT